MIRVVVTKQIPGLKEAVQRLPNEWDTWCNPEETPLSRVELVAQCADASGLLVVGDRIDGDLMDHMPRLKILSNYGVGMDNIDLEAAHSRSILTTNLPDEVTYTTAELAMALLLACARRLREADQLVRSQNPFSWTPTITIGWNLEGKTLGVIGFGRIGQRVARMAQAFSMHVLYYDRTRNYDAEAKLGVEYREFADLLRHVDVVSLHVPGGEETKHMLDTEELSMLKSGAIVINVARGTVIREQALATALREGHLAAAGLDVYENEPSVHHELLDLPNVVLTPHVGTTTWEARTQMTLAAIDNIRKALATDQSS